MTAKKGIGSYPASDPESSGETGRKDDVNPDENMGSNKPRKDGEGDLANPDRCQNRRNKYGQRQTGVEID